LDVGDRLEVDAAAAADLGMHVVHFDRGRNRAGVTPPSGDLLVIHEWSEFR
jgi:FMN phosphatase YigB (HAD superfamily)